MRWTVAYKMGARWERALFRDRREAEAYARRIGPYLQAVGDYIDVLVLSTHDFGTQRGPLFDPALFAQHFVPAWRLLTGAIHAARPGLKLFLHSCGSVRGLIPHFIAAGIDILNPVQWSSDQMDRGELAREFGGRSGGGPLERGVARDALKGRTIAYVPLLWGGQAEVVHLGRAAGWERTDEILVVGVPGEDAPRVFARVVSGANGARVWGKWAVAALAKAGAGAV